MGRVAEQAPQTLGKHQTHIRSFYAFAPAFALQASARQGARTALGEYALVGLIVA